jgi:dienelactone hydrolase
LAKSLVDISVGFDYLCSRPDVDSTELAIIGHSYGGRAAIWAAAVDQRIQAAVSNCGCSSYEQDELNGTGIQEEFLVPGIRRWGDIQDVIRLIAPRKLLLSAGRTDKYCAGIESTFALARDAFPPAQLQLALYDTGHSFSLEMRQHAYNFLRVSLSSVNE